MSRENGSRATVAAPTSEAQLGTRVPPVLLMHGVASSFGHNWVGTGWVTALRQAGREVLAGRLPGHGPEATDEDSGGDIVDAVLSGLNDAEVVDAIGFSAGGYGVIAAAVAHPTRFRRLALIGVGDRMMANDISARLSLADSLVADDDDPAARPFRTVLKRTGSDPHRVARHIRTARPSVTVEQLSTLTAEVIVVLGDDDPVGPASGLQAAIPNCEVLVLPGLGHHRTVTDPRCREAVLAFVGGAR